MRNLTSHANGLRSLLERHVEWLLSRGEDTFYLLSEEISVECESGELRIGFLCDGGLKSITAAAITIEDSQISIDAELPSRRAREVVELVPRAKAVELRESIENARLEAVQEIASKFDAQFVEFQPSRAALNENNGRFAEIEARFGPGNIAVLADVSGVVPHESLLSKALVWLRSLRSRKKRRTDQVWIVSERQTATAVGALIGCLKNEISAHLQVWQPRSIARSGEEDSSFEHRKSRDFGSLWSGRLPRLSLLENKTPTRFAMQMVDAFPRSVDIVNTGKGETIRFRGLPFARTRLIGGNAQVWFGTETKKQLFDASSAPDLSGLCDALSRNRKFNAPNKQHEYYRAAPEAWLESILRRNIKKLDANLVLSPIYNQFRAAREKIDLLALRRDGRLVIIELKIAADRDMLFQAVDYWRKVESQRRRGNLDKLDLFGDKKIANRPTIVYLVAPTLGFHHDLDYFASFVRDEIELYRFDLAENWREGVKVLRRKRMGKGRD